MNVKEKARLSDPDQFMKRFNHLSRQNPEKTYTEIYFMVEREHIEIHNKTKYSSYESFKVIRSRYIRNSLKKEKR